jgi:phosphonate transport system permease protein
MAANPEGRLRSPFTAGLLSALIPGMGQAYARQAYRGAAIFVGTLTVLGMVAWYRLPVWYFAPIGIWLWNVVDAASLAAGRKRSFLLPVLLGLAAAYGIGWQVSQIDFSKANLDRAYLIIRPMLRPDFIEPRREQNTIWVGVEVPCSPNPPRAYREDGGKSLTVTPDCGVVHETMIVTATGLWPNTETNIVWRTPIGDPKMLGGNEDAMLVVTSDEDGAVTAVFRVPTTALVASPDPTLPQQHRVYLDQYRPLGGIKLSFVGGEVLKGASVTVAMALMATTLAMFVAVPISFLAARNLMGGNPITLAIYFIVRTALNILRSIESLIIAIIFVVIVGLGPFAGVMALAIHSVAALAKLYSEVIEGIDAGPIEAVRATGATWVQIVRYAVIPQIVPAFTSFTIYRWDINVRSATVIGLVGGGGLGFLLIELIRVNDMRGVSAVFISIAVIVIVLDFISAKVRERLI